MRQDSHDFLRVHAPLARVDILDRDPLRLAMLVLLIDLAGEFHVQPVARLGGVDMGLDPRREQAEVADDVENLVTHELVLVAERFAREDGVAADDHGVFQAAALDQALLHQRLHLLVKDEGAGLADVFPVIARLRVPGPILRVFAEMVRVGAADLEAVGGPGDEIAAVAPGHADRLGQFILGHRGVEFLLARLFQNFEEEPGAAVADGRLVRIDLDQRIVDTAAAQGGKKMLHGVDLDTPLAERGGALDLLHVVDVGRDRRLVGQIDPLEDKAGVGPPPA